MTRLSNVEKIIKHEALADRGQEAVDKHRWEAARLIWEELATGKTQETLAEEIGKSQSHVSKMARAWQKYSPENSNFQEVYYRLSSKPRRATDPPAADEPEQPRRRAKESTL